MLAPATLMNPTPGQTEAHNARALPSDTIASYFSGAYNNLVSVVQGVALASLVYILQMRFDDPANHPNHLDLWQNILLWSKVLLALLTICTIWHRYITENQFVSWGLTVSDTIIPMVFGVL